MNLDKLMNNEDWEVANIIFKAENWNKEFSEIERTYQVTRNNKYFDSSKIGTSLFGNYLDGLDNDVRLDLYNWKVERIDIIGG